jgi:hypothetical protein
MEETNNPIEQQPIEDKKWYQNRILIIAILFGSIIFAIKDIVLNDNKNMLSIENFPKIVYIVSILWIIKKYFVK